MQKRVELARALVAKPKLILLDEPMAGMTATEKQEMAGFVRAARDNFGTTIILIEHDIGVVMACPTAWQCWITVARLPTAHPMRSRRTKRD